MLKRISSQRGLKRNRVASLATSRLVLAAGSVIMGALGTTSAFGITDGTWTATTNGTWGNSANWSGGSIASGQAGTISTADFTTLTMPSDITVSLDSSRVIGVIKFGDVGATRNWTLNNNGVGTNALALISQDYSNNTATQPTINVVNGTATISANFATGNSPVQQWIKSGAGTVNLTGVSTFGSGVNIIGGTSAAATSTVIVNNSSSSTGVIADANNFNGYRDINIANTTGEFGALTVTAGTVRTLNVAMGTSGTATITVNGGNFNVGTRIKSSGNSNGTATINVSAGNLNFMNNAFIQMGEFNGRPTTVNQTGGLVSFYSDNGTTLGGTGYISAAGGTQTYNLNGGTLAVPQFKFVGQATGSFPATGVLSMNGGTLQTTVASSDFFGTNTTTVASLWNVRSSTGGAIIDTRGNNVTIKNVIAHDSTGATTDGGLTKNDSVGTATLTIQPPTTLTYNGPTKVNAGKLQFVNFGPTSSTSFIPASGATMEFNLGASQVNLTNAVVTGAGTLLKTGTAKLLFTGASVSGAMSAGALVDVQAGTLQASDSNSVQSSWASNLSSLNIASGATFEALLADVKVSSLTGAGTYQSGWFFYRTLTVGANNGSGTFSGVIKNNGQGGANVGATAFAKIGTGTQTLTGANTFNGPMSINGGTVGSPSTVTIAPATTATIGLVSGGTLNIATATNDVCVLNQSGGSISYQTVTLGQAGAATYNLSGGSLNVGSGGMYISNNNNGTGIVNLSGTGAMNFQSNSKFLLGQFFNRPSTINQTGGSVNFYSDAGVTLGGTGGLVINGGTSTYNLGGGTLATPAVGWTASGGGQGGGSGIFNFKGGTLKTTTASTDFFPTGHTTTNVSTGGALIDTSGNNVTINQVLAHDTGLGAGADGGLTKSGLGTLTLSNANTYTGVTKVLGGKLNISGSEINKGSSYNQIALDADGVFSTSDDISLTRSAGSGASYIGYGSSEVGALSSSADIVQGSNAAGSDTTVTMQWRARAANELNGSRPPLPDYITQLASDVIHLTGMVNSGAASGQTDVFALQMSYDETKTPNEVFAASNGGLYLAWLDASASPAPTWKNAVLGDFGVGTSVTANYQGSWTSFASANSITNANLSDYLGSWGVDTTSNNVWAVINHNSDFAVVPEPASMTVLSIGALALTTRRRRSMR